MTYLVLSVSVLHGFPPQVKAMPAHQKANLAAAEEAAANGAVALYKPPMAGVGASAAGAMDKSNPLAGLSAGQGHQLAIRKGPSMPKPTWHAPWKLFRVISGHMGWVSKLVMIASASHPHNEEVKYFL